MPKYSKWMVFAAVWGDEVLKIPKSEYCTFPCYRLDRQATTFVAKRLLMGSCWWVGERVRSLWLYCSTRLMGTI